MLNRGLFTFFLRAVIAACLFLLLLELFSVRVGLSSLLAVFSGLKSLWSDGTLSHDIEVTAARWGIGWTAGALAGISLGLLTGRVETASIMLEWLFILLRAIPFIALLPLTLRFFGISEPAKFFLVGWATAGTCWVITHQRASNIDPILKWRSLALGASERRWLLRVLLPACNDSIYTALRTSLALALLVVAVAEMGGVYQRSTGLWWSEGLGYRIFRSYDIARDDYLLGGILVFALLGILVEQGFTFIWMVSAELNFHLRQERARAAVAEQRGKDRPTPFSMPQPVSLEISNVHASYRERSVITDLSLDIPAGSTLSVIGPSGCGKTTLLRAVAHLSGDGLDISGTVKVAGITRTSPGVWMGVVFQDSPVFDQMTVWENVIFGSRALHSTAWDLLCNFGLAEHAADRARTLSGGQRQRLALAAALANSPEVLLLDEPFGALDAITRRQLQSFYRTHVRGKITAMFVTHDLNEALLVGNEVAVGVNSDRKVLSSGNALSHAPEWEFTAEFAQLKEQAFSELQHIADAAAHEDHKSGTAEETIVTHP